MGRRRSSGTAAMQAVVLWLLIWGAWDRRGIASRRRAASILSRQKVSPACWQRMRVTHFVECVCPISPKLASLVRAYGVKRIVGEIRRCGGTIPRNYKCGSITTPP
ncbi:hypothetical protein BT93_K2449 [Corymbia citriodora subsp. variegata]|nr:hypothetical protein BT93_K2449 [Corymbia citriodora subsp. variegata]